MQRDTAEAIQRLAYARGAAEVVTAVDRPSRAARCRPLAAANAAAGFQMAAAGSRSYFSYDPIGFPKHSQVLLIPFPLSKTYVNTKEAYINRITVHLIGFLLCYFAANGESFFSVFQVGFDAKAGSANCFPNQLISLSRIGNYAHQPTDLLHSLAKEKAGQVSQ